MTVFDDPEWVRRIIAQQVIRDRIERRAGRARKAENCRWCEK